MSREELKRLRALEAENRRLRRVVSDPTLDNVNPVWTSRGNF